MSDATTAAHAEPAPEPHMAVLAALDTRRDGWRGYIGLGAGIEWAAPRTHASWKAARRYARDRATKIGFWP